MEASLIPYPMSRVIPTALLQIFLNLFHNSLRAV